MENKMFCFQCQETVGNKGCSQIGVCGKTPTTAKLQDILIDVTKELAEGLNELSNQQKIDDLYHDQISKNLFITITNANFDDEMISTEINKTINLKKAVFLQLDNQKNFSSRIIDENIETRMNKVGVLKTENEDIRSLKELITYGLKGMAAYNHHSQILGYRDSKIDCFIIEALVKIDDPKMTLDDYLALTMETGKYGVAVMKLLDKANTDTYGHPEITEVSLNTRNNPGILVSGHDLRDLEMLLEQTKDTGIDVYSHGEMLPAHYYPFFKKYDHFVGNYGNAWWQQKEEFLSFNGPILLTTNCLVPPLTSYQERIYTTGAVGFPGCHYIVSDDHGYKDFSAIIEHAKKCKPPKSIEDGKIVGGFAHHQVLALANQIVESVNSGKIKKFVVMAGCDGRHPTRQYYQDFALNLPQDTIILTAGCAKYRYNKLDLGTINGIPRVLDAGQCNDSYSLAMIALKLQEVFGLDDINDLPIIYNIAWYEQKAVIVLLALLSLGVKNIHLGPTLPAFLSKNVIAFLVENFKMATIQTVKEDLDLFFPEKETVDKFNGDMLVGQIMEDPRAMEILSNNGMGCLGCPASQVETLADACMVHGLDVEEMLKLLNQ
ncbi:MAG: hydroxylamine reductase [Thomasclavelia sp.]